MNKIRCNWPNLENNEIYKEYHDNEWGIPSYEDNYLFEMILLESFHCGLSWLIILKKRDAFRKAFDNFNPNIIRDYSEKKITELMENKDIVRNKAKILANIENAKAFIKVQKEFNSFSNYIWSFTNNEVVYGGFNDSITKNELSDKVSKDMKKRGFKFMGSVTTYSYLEAIGVMNNHSSKCFRNHMNVEQKNI
jgi:DNA-3-methyladenine glycosylase I